MKATIDLDNDLYRRTKVLAAMRGLKIKELVAEGLRHILEGSPAPAAAPTGGHYSRYWNRYFGAVKGGKWDRPASLPAEKREEW